MRTSTIYSVGKTKQKTLRNNNNNESRRGSVYVACERVVSSRSKIIPPSHFGLLLHSYSYDLRSRLVVYKKKKTFYNSCVWILKRLLLFFFFFVSLCQWFISHNNTQDVLIYIRRLLCTQNHYLGQWTGGIYARTGYPFLIPRLFCFFSYILFIAYVKTFFMFFSTPKSIKNNFLLLKRLCLVFG